MSECQQMVLGVDVKEGEDGGFGSGNGGSAGESRVRKLPPGGRAAAAGGCDSRARFLATRSLLPSPVATAGWGKVGWGGMV